MMMYWRKQGKGMEAVTNGIHNYNNILKICDIKIEDISKFAD
jgi:hypothetical protein